ncbi:hypothetical protein ACTFIV_005081, partial [Dictyostelium citrinum]
MVMKKSKPKTNKPNKPNKNKNKNNTLEDIELLNDLNINEYLDSIIENINNNNNNNNNYYINSNNNNNFDDNYNFNNKNYFKIIEFKDFKKCYYIIPSDHNDIYEFVEYLIALKNFGSKEASTIFEGIKNFERFKELYIQHFFNNDKENKNKNKWNKLGIDEIGEMYNHVSLALMYCEGIVSFKGLIMNELISFAATLSNNSLYKRYHEQILVLLAFYFKQEKKHIECELYCNIGIKIFPNNENFYYLRGTIHFEKSSSQQCHLDCKAGLKVNPNHLGLLFLKAGILLDIRNSNPDQSDQILAHYIYANKAHYDHSFMAEAYFYIGLLSITSKEKFKVARKIYEYGIELQKVSIYQSSNRYNVGRDTLAQVFNSYDKCC